MLSGSLALFLLFAAEASDVETALKKFASVYALVEREAASPVDPNLAVYEGALPGLLRTLDPHSVFFTPDHFEQLKELERATSKGFGTVVSVLPGRVIVLQTIPGTPSARAGIAAGDEILAINGIRLDWLEMEQLVQLLGETRRREARLDVRRAGSPRLLQFTLTPEELASPSVDRAFLLRPEIGYVRVASFDAETGKQLKEAVETLGGAGLKGLILDLRDNPGGVLGSALETAALFLPPGKKLLTVRGRAQEADEPAVPEGGTPYLFALAILINGKSASGAEIVAGAMQDHGRAEIVGEPSFGKGLVQSIYPLSEGTGIALTTAFYYTPSGRSIQRPLSGSQLDSAIQGGAAGGIHPDHLARPEPVTRLRAALDATGSATSFATEFIKKNPEATADFQVSDALLDELRVYLSERNINPGVSEWSVDREWIRSRLRQEIFNQALGVDKGDEVEMRRDPVVLKALEVLGLR